MDLAVVLVTWNVRDLVQDALRTLLVDIEDSGLQTEIWVVDNASADGTAAEVGAQFPQVRVIASPDNLGFAGGNNLALRTMGFGGETPSEDLPRAVFLLNPDTLVERGALRALYDALFAAPDVGLVGARLAYGDGSFQHSAFHFPGILQTMFDLLPMPGRLYESRLNGRYPRELYEGGVPFEVDHMLGATLLLRREVIEQTGMFDPQFFMYCEEIDWSMRIRQAGWCIQCVPAARITHLEGRSTSQVRPTSVVNLWRSRFQLYRKHYSPLKVALIRGVVQIGMRRKIAQTRRNTALTDEQRADLVAAYRAVMAL